MDKVKEDQIVLMIDGKGIQQQIKINENLSVNNIKAVIGYDTQKDYVVEYNNQILEG